MQSLVKCVKHSASLSVEEPDMSLLNTFSKTAFTYFTLMSACLLSRDTGVLISSQEPLIKPGIIRELWKRSVLTS